MKTLILLILTLFSTLILNAQKLKYQIGDVIKTIVPIVIEEKSFEHPFSLTESVKNDSVISIQYNLNIIESNILLVVVDKDSENNKYTVNALDFKVYSKEKIKKREEKNNFNSRLLIDKSIRSDLYNDKIFIINKKKLENSTKIHDSKDPINIGILSLPFKFRPNANEIFSLEFNINTSISFHLIPIRAIDFWVQIGAGIGSVGLNTTNSSGIEPGNEINTTVLTGLTGLMIQYNKIQAGIYMGIDYVNNQDKYGWESHKKTWFSLGIGYELFSVPISEMKRKNQNN